MDIKFVGVHAETYYIKDFNNSRDPRNHARYETYVQYRRDEDLIRSTPTSGVQTGSNFVTSPHLSSPVQISYSTLNPESSDAVFVAWDRHSTLCLPKHSIHATMMQAVPSSDPAERLGNGSATTAGHSGNESGDQTNDHEPTKSGAVSNEDLLVVWQGIALLTADCMGVGVLGLPNDIKSLGYAAGFTFCWETFPSTTTQAISCRFWPCSWKVNTTNSVGHISTDTNMTTR